MGFSRQEVLGWVAISFSRESSQPRDRTQVSHTVDRRFTIWATREVKLKKKLLSHVRLLWNSPGQSTGVGSLSLLQGIFPTQGLNLGLPYCRQILYQLSHTTSPKKGTLWLHGLGNEPRPPAWQVRILVLNPWMYNAQGNAWHTASMECLLLLFHPPKALILFSTVPTLQNLKILKKK